uniref:Uncharacterized protein n=1 Tax=Timema monikensis TaxID=170555 RepID=A0A7R9EFN1_9NEOP|nr:unnamed protein product [Timema monikensis]
MHTSKERQLFIKFEHGKCPSAFFIGAVVYDAKFNMPNTLSFHPYEKLGLNRFLRMLTSETFTSQTIL